VGTGVLGEQIRALGTSVGVAVPPLYRSKSPRISALMLPVPNLVPDPARVALGKDLFVDKRLSRGAVRACASCHDPAKVWADGVPTPTSLTGEKIVRHTPSLLYAPLAATLHWDGRVRTADAQALLPIHAKAEMGLSSDALLAVLAKDAALVARFAAAFDDGLTEANVGRAIAHYEAATLVPAGAPVDRFARGDEGALDAELRLGLDVFAGKGRCARCHVPPVFGGTRAPDFTVPIYAVLGVPRTPGVKGTAVLDDDAGRAAMTGLDVDRGAFRTPTVRNVGRSAPYFHHGAFPTLESVLEFYEKGGGKALGLDVPNQDPDVRPLVLTDAERRGLLRFLREGLADP
jgi:cytochrome c peroxidase